MSKLIKERERERKHWFLISISILAIFLTISMVNDVNAVDITIDPSTSGGIARAIDSAQSDIVNIYLENGVYKGNNNVELYISSERYSKGNSIGLDDDNYPPRKIPRKVNIIGKGSNVVINGQGKNVFLVDNLPFSLKNIKIINSDHGIKGLSGDELNISNCKFDNNIVAIDAGSGSKTLVTECVFTNNKGFFISALGKTFLRKPAVSSSESSSLTVINSVFSKNKGCIDSERFIVKKCMFTNNEIACISGGGNISDSVFKNNKGIAISINAPPVITTINRCTFTNNQGEKNRGAIYLNYETNTRIFNCKFVKNTAGNVYKAISKAGITAWYTKANVTITPKDGTVKNKNTIYVLDSNVFVNQNNARISIDIDKSKLKAGKTIVRLKTPINIEHKSFKVSIGSAKYNKKNKVLTWTLTNSALAKKQATINWVLRANKKGIYKITPAISSPGNKIKNKKNISFRITSTNNPGNTVTLDPNTLIF